MLYFYLDTSTQAHKRTTNQAEVGRLMERSWRERREASSTTADGEIDSYTACINSLSLEREMEGGRERGEKGGGGVTGKYEKLWREREQRRVKEKSE